MYLHFFVDYFLYYFPISGHINRKVKTEEFNIESTEEEVTSTAETGIINILFIFYLQRTV